MNYNLTSKNDDTESETRKTMATTQPANHKAKWISHTRQQLAEIPQLAADAITCRDHPWRGTHLTTRRNTPDNAPAPTSLEWLDAMDQRTGCLAKLATLCDETSHTFPTETKKLSGKKSELSWKKICEYLAKNLEQISTEPRLADKTKTITADAHNTLTTLVGQVITYVLHCPQCGLPLKPPRRHHDDTWTCPLGHRYNIATELAKLSDAATVTTTQACQLIGCTPRQLHYWQKRGWIKPAGHTTSQNTWHITDLQTAANTATHQHLTNPTNPTRLSCVA